MNQSYHTFLSDEALKDIISTIQREKAFYERDFQPFVKKRKFNGLS